MKFQKVFLGLAIAILVVVLFKYHISDAYGLQPEAHIPGYCEKYGWPKEREREVCEMAEQVPCLTLWGMWLMADNESKAVKQIIAKKYVKRGCLYGAY